MNNPEQKVKTIESFAIIFGVGFVVSLAIIILEFLNDWRHSSIKDFSNYLSFALYICLPFFIGLAITVYLARKKT